MQAVLFGGGFILGLAVGRWWVLLAAVALGAWIASVTEVEVAQWYLGLAYAAVAGLGIAAGVGLRRNTHADPSPTPNGRP